MKKTYLLFILLLMLCVGLMSQSKALYINETFDEPDFPEGWEILSWTSTNWEIANSNQAEGEPYEISMMWVPDLSGVTGRLGAPIVDLSDVAGQLVLEFQYKVMNMGDCLLGVATTSDDGVTWNIAYQEESPQYPSPLVNAYVEIDTPDVGSENFRFCFFFHSDDGGMSTKRWFIDNVVLYDLADYDVQILKLNGVAEATEHGINEIGFSFINKGIQTVTSLEARYQFEGIPEVVEVFNSLSIPQNESYSLTFTEKITLHTDVDYLLEVVIDKINGVLDQAPGNNSISMNVFTYPALAEKRFVIDHFSSSTCDPCPGANELMKIFLENHPNQYVISKYQMNWPGSGDPYFNADGDIRRNFYNVSGVPKIFFNGENINNYSNLEGYFNIYYPKQIPIVDISGAFNVEGTTVNVDFNILSYIDLENVVVHVSVNEKHTTGNVGNNGETDFYHVMMKMLPDGNGTSTNFVKSEARNFTFQYDMSNTFVEELDDLEIAVWVQDPTTKKIYNGNYLVEATELDNNPPQNLFLSLSSVICHIDWDAPAKTSAVYNVYVNNEIIASNISETFLSYQIEDVYTHAIYTIKVSAVYPNDVESVKISDYVFYDGIGIDKYDNNLTIYPNPTDNFFIINSEQVIKRIELYNTIGQNLEIINTNTNNLEVNTNNYSKGIYFVKVFFTDDTTAVNKVVIR